MLLTFFACCYLYIHSSFKNKTWQAGTLQLDEQNSLMHTEFVVSTVEKKQTSYPHTECLQVTKKWNPPLKTLSPFRGFFKTIYKIFDAICQQQVGFIRWKYRVTVKILEIVVILVLVNFKKVSFQLGQKKFPSSQNRKSSIQFNFGKVVFNQKLIKCLSLN